jgi:hypothetical protein
MTYSCSDFTDDILNALAITLADDEMDDPQAQAGHALEAIATLKVAHACHRPMLLALKAVQDDYRELLRSGPDPVEQEEIGKMLAMVDAAIGLAEGVADSYETAAQEPPQLAPAVAHPLIAKVRDLASMLEDAIDTHIYQDDEEPDDAPERKLVYAARQLADQVEANALPDLPDAKLRQAAQTLVLTAAAVQDADEAGESEAASIEWTTALIDMAHATDAVTAALKAATPATAAAERLALPPVAFAAIFEHKHGRTITIHAAREQAETTRQSVASQFWRDEMKGEPPADPKEMADAYFQHMGERGHEFFSIEECPVEPEAPR